MNFLVIIDFERAFNLLDLKLHDWVNLLVLKMPNIVVAVFLFLLTVYFARYSAKLIHKVLEKSGVNHGLSFLIERFTYLFVLFVGIFASLNFIGLDKTVTSLLAGAGIIGLALSFAFQNIAANFISGVMIAVRRPYAKGDIIESQKIRGKVLEIKLHHTIVKNKGGQSIILPNKELYEEPLYNYTKFGSREIELMVPIPLDSDLDKTRTIIVEALQKEPGILQDEKIDVYFMRFDTYCIHTEVNYWVNYQNIKDFEESTSHGLEAIYKAFQKQGIKIPALRHKVDLEK